MVERWEGLLRACCTGCDNPTRIMASLICCPTTGALVNPSSNAILFMGDSVQGIQNPIIKNLSSLESVAEILISKLGPSVNAWVLEASRFQGPFACYDAFLPYLSLNGEPLCYDPKGLPATRAIYSLLQNCLVQVNKECLKCSGDCGSSVQNVSKFPVNCIEESVPSISSTGNIPKTLVFGFSKGGVVLNQLLTELAHVERHGRAVVEDSERQAKAASPMQGGGLLQRKLQAINTKVAKILQWRSVAHSESNSDTSVVHEHEASCAGSRLFPGSIDEFHKSIAEIHYIDVGLNCPGAYQTDPVVLETVVKAATSSRAGLRLAFHGTPRQWNDKTRYWISLEKDCCIRTLQSIAKRLNSDKIRITEKLYFGGDKPSLQMHFQILESLNLD